VRALISSVPFNRQSVASKAGILLEHRLNDLALRYETPLPYRKSPVYAIGDLYGGLAKKMREVRVIRPQMDGASVRKNAEGSELTEAVELNKLFESIFSLAFVRNATGAHYNFADDDISDSDIMEFATRVAKFAEATVCPSCHSLPKWTEGTHYRCRCKRFHMTPLKT
jgi:hypothetical protein